MRIFSHCITSALVVSLVLGTVSCASIGNSSIVKRHRERVLFHWSDDGGPGKVSIRISLPDQIAEFKRGSRPIGWCYVATGKEGHGTSAGNYKITEKIEDKYSNRYGWIEDELGNVVDGDAKPSDRVPPGMVYVAAPMPYWMRLTSYGIGMHGGLIPEPGKPASHGCIRLPKDFVPQLFEVVEVGTPVLITQEPSVHGPEKSQPQPQQSPMNLPDGSRIIATRPLRALNSEPTNGSGRWHPREFDGSEFDRRMPPPFVPSY